VKLSRQAASRSSVAVETSRWLPASTVSRNARLCPGGSSIGRKGKLTGKRLAALSRWWALTSIPKSKAKPSAARAPGSSVGSSCADAGPPAASRATAKAIQGLTIVRADASPLLALHGTTRKMRGQLRAIAGEGTS
jgi:hypothetical protein